MVKEVFELGGNYDAGKREGKREVLEHLRLMMDPVRVEVDGVGPILYAVRSEVLRQLKALDPETPEGG